MKAMQTRQNIVTAADQLFYEHGFGATSFGDIAHTVGLSRGNFYYHFKTKDELLDAVIARRAANTRALLDGWQAELETPKARICRFFHLLIENRQEIMVHGCPVGTLCNELAKIEHGSRGAAGDLFTLFREWLGKQFAELGRQSKSDELALHVLMRSQGVATLATAFKDEAFVRREVEEFDAWVDGQVPTSGVPVAKI